MKIDTFKGLGSPGRDNPLNYELDRQRKDYTTQLMHWWQVRPYSILDVAGPSVVGKWIAEDFNCKLYHTIGDLDKDWKPELQHVHTVICLEVMEHLLNPMKFLIELEKKVIFQHLIISWPHRPSWLWSNHHFHEYDLSRFEYLVHRSGYEIVHIDKRPEFTKWWQHLTGIRPMIRPFVSTHYFAHLKFVRKINK